MNRDLTNSDLIDSSTAIKPNKTPLVIGPGIVLKGIIVSQDEDPETQMMIMGRVEGDITTKGVIQIAKGGEIAGNAIITAGAIVVAGRITGSNVSVRTDLMVMHSTAVVNVDKIMLPPGRLEMRRGSLLVGQLITADYLFPAQNSQATEIVALKTLPQETSDPSAYSKQVGEDALDGA